MIIRFFYWESFSLLEEQPFRRCKYIIILEKHHCQSQWWKGSSESHQEQKCDHEDQTTPCQETSDTKIQRGSEFRFLQIKPDVPEGWKRTFWSWLESQSTCAEHGEDIVLAMWLLTEAAEGLLNRRAACDNTSGKQKHLHRGNLVVDSRLQKRKDSPSQEGKTTALPILVLHVQTLGNMEETECYCSNHYRPNWENQLWVLRAEMSLYHHLGQIYAVLFCATKYADCSYWRWKSTGDRANVHLVI